MQTKAISITTVTTAVRILSIVTTKMTKPAYSCTIINGLPHNKNNNNTKMTTQKL